MVSPRQNREDSSSNVIDNDNASALQTPEDARFRRFCLHYMQSYTVPSSAPWIVRGSILRVAQSFRSTSTSFEMLNLYIQLVAQFTSCDAIDVFNDQEGAMLRLERWKNFEDAGSDHKSTPWLSFSSSQPAPAPVNHKKRKCPFRP